MRGFFFLAVAIACLAAFVVAWAVSGQLIPFWQPEPEVSLRGGPGSAFDAWAIVQNVSALAGIVSFLVQVVQWRRSA